jgi:hypothetical protein
MLGEGGSCGVSASEHRARICKRFWSPGIDSEESISLAYLAWWAGMTNRVVVRARQTRNRYLGSLKGLQIRVQLSTEAQINIGDLTPYLTYGQVLW